MKYASKSFSVSSPGTKEYADNWERTFRGPKSAAAWTGPLESDLFPDGQLKERVPPERWPYGPPAEHGTECILFIGGLYCDCLASDAAPHKED